MKPRRDPALERRLLTLSDRYHATQDQAARARIRAEYRDTHARWDHEDRYWIQDRDGIARPPQDEDHEARP